MADTGGRPKVRAPAHAVQPGRPWPEAHGQEVRGEATSEALPRSKNLPPVDFWVNTIRALGRQGTASIASAIVAHLAGHYAGFGAGTRSACPCVRQGAQPAHLDTAQCSRSCPVAATE